MPRTASPARSTGNTMDTEKGRKALRYFVYLTLFTSLVVTVVYGSMAIYSMNEAHQRDPALNVYTDEKQGLDTTVRNFQLNSFSALVAFAFALLLSILSLHFRM